MDEGHAVHPPPSIVTPKRVGRGEHPEPKSGILDVLGRIREVALHCRAGQESPSESRLREQWK